MKKNAFSVAEAFVSLLIVSVALGVSAPMISRQIKANNLNEAQIVMLKKEIRTIKEIIGENGEDGRNGQDGENGKTELLDVPAGAVMFFNLTACPDGWSPLATDENKLDGYYPRIAKEGSDEIGTIKEQMVHRHKHISPVLQVPNTNGSIANFFRYGPVSAKFKASDSITGDTDLKYSYPALSLMKNGKAYDVTVGGSYGLGGMGFQTDNNNWFMYTSDGMNRYETFKGYNDKMYPILTCPNKDEADENGNVICKATGNKIAYTNGNVNMTMDFDNPHYNSMPLVGNENRPNSLVLLACQKK